MNPHHLLILIVAISIPAKLELQSATYHLDSDTGITLPEGFDAELVYDVPKSQGSWVAMTFDPEKRLIVSDQDDKGVFRVTLPPENQPNNETQ